MQWASPDCSALGSVDTDDGLIKPPGQRPEPPSQRPFSASDSGAAPGSSADCTRPETQLCRVGGALQCKLDGFIPAQGPAGVPRQLELLGRQ